ncbi:MAG: Gfo/Idh/MocA family oxidoreductase, partial [Vallitaleaceae bacterium]|nr:Gfo/Idh/MocA family oxidoreductase [Vallitaleaceae bacterium]
MNKVIRWGILGTGTIANTFAGDLNLVKTGVLGAVASRGLEKAEAFAKKYGAAKFYGSYEELAKDPEIDAIYVASPHSQHKENTLLCLNHKKAVLCEKPFAINATEAAEMIECAKKNGVFLMEAMWTRFLPNIKYVNEIIEKGEIGAIRWLKADFGFALPEDFPASHRLLNKELGGGALLDVGI